LCNVLREINRDETGRYNIIIVVIIITAFKHLLRREFVCVYRNVCVSHENDRKRLQSVYRPMRIGYEIQHPRMVIVCVYTFLHVDAIRFRNLIENGSFKRDRMDTLLFVEARTQIIIINRNGSGAVRSFPGGRDPFENRRKK